MATRLKSSDFPQDNSHFPVTLKPGDRTGWWLTKGYRAAGSGEMKFTSTPADLLTRLDHPGHTPTLVLDWKVTTYHAHVEPSITCSCGHVMNNRYIMNTSGNWSKSFPARWNAHREVADNLATPVLVWESKASRATYTCHIASSAHLDRFKTRWRPTGVQLYVIVQSSHSKQAHLRGTNNTVADAMATAQSLGREEEANGRAVTWHEEPVVTGVSTSVADLLRAIQTQGNSDDLPTLLATRKLADEFLSFAEPITELRDQIQGRIDSLFDV